MTEPLICPHRQIRITVPRATLRRLSAGHSVLTIQQAIKMRAYKLKLDATLAELNHVASIVDKILNRAI